MQMSPAEGPSMNLRKRVDHKNDTRPNTRTADHQLTLLTDWIISNPLKPAGGHSRTEMMIRYSFEK